MEKIYTNADGSQTAKLFIPELHKKLCVSVSSGTDSALLLYLVCSYLTENKREGIEIIALHLIDLVRTPKSKPDFDGIIDRFEKEFPNITFTRRYVTLVEDRSKNVNKTTVVDKEIVKLISEGVESLFFGRTKNPPKEVYETFGMDLRPALVEREEENITAKNIRRMFDKDRNEIYTPENCAVMTSKFLLTVDRSFIAEYYNKINFLKELFPLTRSCVRSDIKLTSGWTKPCEQCWWCKEKFWAFHKYDGGILE
jgi:hypothetical protein